MTYEGNFLTDYFKDRTNHQKIEVFVDEKISDELIRIKYFYENVLLFTKLVSLYMEYVNTSLTDMGLICVYLRFQQITPINDTQGFCNF